MTKSRSRLVTLLLTAAALLLLWVPLLWLHGRAFVYAAQNPSVLVDLSPLEPVARKLFTNTLLLSLCTAGLCLLVGTPVGFALARAPLVWRNPALVFTALPMALPPVIAAGPFVSLKGAADHPLLFSTLALSTCYFPLVALAVWAAVGAVPPEEEDAARLYASELAAWTGPLAERVRPALLGSAALVAAFAAWEMGAPDLLGWPSYSMHVYRALNDATAYSGQEKSLRAALAALPVLCLGLGFLLLALPAVRLLGAGIPNPQLRESPLGKIAAVLSTTLLVLAPGWLFWKICTELGTTGETRRAVTANLDALTNTLTCSLAGAVLALFLALALTTGWRNWPPAWKRAALVACLFPLLFAPVVLGVALVEFFNRDALGWLYDSRLGMVIYGLTCRFFPVATVLMWVASQQVEEELLWASGNLGAAPWRTLLSILIPLVRNAVLGGFAVLFALCAGELTVTVLVQQPGGETLILPIFNFLHAGLASEVAALCLLLLLLTGGSMAAAALLLKRSRVK